MDGHAALRDAPFGSPPFQPSALSQPVPRENQLVPGDSPNLHGSPIAAQGLEADICRDGCVLAAQIGMDEMILRVACMIVAATALSGCVARAAYDVGTAPIRAGSKVVDWTTTSKSEADRNRGRQAKKMCDRERKEARRQSKQSGIGQPLPAFCR
jgi:hypothetical protein